MISLQGTVLFETLFVHKVPISRDTANIAANLPSAITLAVSYYIMRTFSVLIMVPSPYLLAGYIHNYEAAPLHILSSNPQNAAN